MNPNDLLRQLDLDQLAARVGADPAAVESAVQSLLPTLLMGLGANAQDPAGEASLASALQKHDPSLVEGKITPDRIDVEDGQKITRHIFGSNEDAVVQQVGGLLGNQSELVRKLLPILAPIVLAWLSGRMQQQSQTKQAPQQTQQAPETKSEPVRKDEGSLRDLLNEITGGAAAPQQAPQTQQAPEAPKAEQPQAQQAPQQTQQAPQQQGGGIGGAILNEILGGLLGGGRR